MKIFPAVPEMTTAGAVAYIVPTRPPVEVPSRSLPGGIFPPLAVLRSFVTRYLTNEGTTIAAPTFIGLAA